MIRASRSKLALLLLWLAISPGYAASCDQPPKVSKVYPSGNILPENLLRFYIYFSVPMAHKSALQGIYLMDGQGQRVKGAFLSNKVDLWSPDDRRLTVLFDPGRVKTGLIAHNTFGRAFKSGQDYTLIIDKTLHSANGCAMTTSHYKKFHVTNEDFKSPDLAKWQITPPQTGTTDWLSVKLNGPHDHVSLAYRVRVIDDTGTIVPGQIALGNNEAEWRFKPTAVWKPASYRITIDPILEDIAGNRITGSFEQPIDQANSNPPFLKFHPIPQT